MTASPNALSLRDARQRYFQDNGFAPDGGYGAAWVDFKLGPLPFPFPNTRPRVRAVRFHDLHHIVTGYRTTFLGELEISAWEIGSGCAGMVVAWQLNLGGLAFGTLVAPRRIWRAFLRGRRTRNFYRRELDDALLSTSVAAARRELALEPEPWGRASAGDVAAFVAAAAAGWIVGAVSFTLFAPLALVAVGPLHLLRARSRAATG